MVKNFVRFVWSHFGWETSAQYIIQTLKKREREKIGTNERMLGDGCTCVSVENYAFFHLLLWNLHICVYLEKNSIRSVELVEYRCILLHQMFVPSLFQFSFDDLQL